MNASDLPERLEFARRERRDRCGLKGPRAAEWLEANGIASPAAPNQWNGDPDAGLLVARLGSSEFFLEEGVGGSALRGVDPARAAPGPGVYPVLREDAAFSLSGEGSQEVLAQVCNVNFADLELVSRPVIMTLMIGVAVLIVPQRVSARPRFRIWCDPSFGGYLEESLGAVVTESGGNHRIDANF
jgi:sarcosine oxidase subunit gamma